MAQLYLSALPTLFLATLALGCGDTAASTAGGTGGGGEAPLGAFANPEVVTIDGWTEDAMEPFLSRDGSILFFNDSNAPNANTNLHWATRVDDTTFSYVCGLDEGDNPLTDPSCWIKANPLLGVTITEQYLSEVVAQAKAIPGQLNGILRLHFCVWTDAETAWMARATPT